MPSISIIINHASGSGREIDAGRIEQNLRSQGFEPNLVLARDGSQIAAAAKRAREERVDVVVAGGGDGTVNCIASAILGSGIVFGVLPLGTLNHFAKDLGIPLDVDQALRAIVEGHRIAIDVAEVNGKAFLNNSSIGLYPEIVKERESGQRRFGRSKWVAFLWACILAARRYPFLDVKLTTDGRSYARRTPFVFVGNNEYTIDGLQVGGRRTLSAGTLSLYVAQRTGRLGLLGFAARALFGTLRQAKDFDAVLSAEIVVKTRRKRLRVSTDGEVTMMDAPLVYRIRPAALDVIVPRPVASAPE
jgi:YegS/Rv2252/BmrU family lipid kinase